MGKDAQLKTRIFEYVIAHRALLLVLLLVGAAGIGGGWRMAPGSTGQTLWFAFGTGVLSSLVIAVVSDFTNKEFFYNVLDNFQTSTQEGGLLHSSHKNVLPRVEAIRRFLGSAQTAKIITLTADNYLSDETVSEELRSKMGGGAKVQILLHTPIFALRSYVEAMKLQPIHQGKRHLSALELVRQQSVLIPTIEQLQQSYPNNFQLKFFSVQMNMHAAILGNRRIFASPILRGVEGIETPCIEIFPGLKDSQLFAKFEGNFDYLWTRMELTFELAELKPLYARILKEYPLEVSPSAVDPKFVEEIEKAAADILERKKLASVALQLKAS